MIVEGTAKKLFSQKLVSKIGLNIELWTLPSITGGPYKPKWFVCMGEAYTIQIV